MTKAWKSIATVTMQTISLIMLVATIVIVVRMIIVEPMKMSHMCVKHGYMNKTIYDPWENVWYCEKLENGTTVIRSLEDILNGQR